MPPRRRISSSQARSRMRQAVNKVNQAIRKYNRETKAAVDKYNREVRAHNARVRAHRQRVKQEFAKLKQRSTSTTTHVRYTPLRVSAQTVHEAYVRYEAHVGVEPANPWHAETLDLAEREDANILAVTNALLDETPVAEEEAPESLQETAITDELRSISTDLDQRWRGAVYALSPQNPDACRHFCASTREVFTQMVHLKAPDEAVLEAFPSCEVTERGKPTRRSRIRYALSMKGMNVEELEDFVERDIGNILELFDVLNSGTHGAAGKYNLTRLKAIKTRAEEGLMFLARIVN